MPQESYIRAICLVRYQDCGEARTSGAGLLPLRIRGDSWQRACDLLLAQLGRHRVQPAGPCLILDRPTQRQTLTGFECLARQRRTGETKDGRRS